MASTYTTTNIGGFNFPDCELTTTGEMSTTRWGFDGFEKLSMEKPKPPSFDPTTEEEPGLSACRADVFPFKLSIDPDALALFSQDADEHDQILSQTSVSHFSDEFLRGYQHGDGEGQWASGSKDPFLPLQKYASDATDNSTEYCGGFDGEGLTHDRFLPAQQYAAASDGTDNAAGYYPPAYVNDSLSQELILPAPRFSPEPEDDVYQGFGEDDNDALGGVEMGVPPLLRPRPRPLRVGAGGQLDAAAAEAAPATAATATHRQLDEEEEIGTFRAADGRRTRRADRRAGVGPYARLPLPAHPPQNLPSPQLPQVPQTRRLRSQTASKANSGSGSGSTQPEPEPKSKPKPKRKPRPRKSKSAPTRNTASATTSDAPQPRYPRVQSQRGMRFILPCLLPDCPSAPSPSTRATFTGFSSLREHLVTKHKISPGRSDKTPEPCWWPGFVSDLPVGPDGIQMVQKSSHLRKIEGLLGVRYVCGGVGCGYDRTRLEDVKDHWAKVHGGRKEDAVYDEVYWD